MADPYIRNCKFCGNRIRMAKMDSGQYLPFDIEGGKHQCQGAAVSITPSVHYAAIPLATPQSIGSQEERPLELHGGASVPIRGGLRWPGWLLILFFLLLLAQWLRT